MKVLLDTQAILWFVLDDQRLSAAARQTIEDSGNEILISPASYWEMAIKISLGKYVLQIPFEEFWSRAIEENSFTVLPVEVRHTARVASMPFLHKDPFDRLLVAQAQAEDIPLVSADGALETYGISRIW